MDFNYHYVLLKKKKLSETTYLMGLKCVVQQQLYMEYGE